MQCITSQYGLPYPLINDRHSVTKNRRKDVTREFVVVWACCIRLTIKHWLLFNRFKFHRLKYICCTLHFPTEHMLIMEGLCFNCFFLNFLTYPLNISK